MWVNNSGDYITNTQFVEDYPADPRPSNITSIWRTNEFINHGYPFIPLMIDLPNLQPMTFEQFVADLFNTSSDFDSDFKTKIQLITDKTTQEFIQALLNFLSSHSNDEEPEYFLESEFGAGGFFDFIQNNTDIANEDFPEGFWNESVQELINKYKRTFGQNPIIPIDDVNSFDAKDIKNADAGYKFDFIGVLLPILLRPWHNIDMNTYYEVRQIIDNTAVASDNKLDFTRKQADVDEYENNLSNWIRLLMPNNTRRIAVEDLNRNFWVISSVVQAVCSYIWGQASPITSMLKDILNELVQLWENIMFLWVSFMLISQKGGRGIKTIIMPLPRTEFQPYRKYDDFITGAWTVTGNEEADKEAEQNFILKRIQPIIQKYRYTNLCILPYTRTKNYYQSFYKSESYRGVVFYNCKKDKITYIPFHVKSESQGDGTPIPFDENKTVYFNPDDYKSILYAIRETETYYRWSYPLGKIYNVTDAIDGSAASKRFYGAYRIIPDIEVGYDGEDLCIKKLKLLAIDAAAKSLFNTERKIVSYELQQSLSENDKEGVFNLKYEDNDAESLGNYGVYDGLVKQAYYLGELPSCTGLSKGNPTFVPGDSLNIMGSGKLIKIGNYLPQNFHTLPNNFDQKPSYYGMQLTPNGTHETDYLLNMTITAPNNSTGLENVRRIYGGIGSSNIVSANSCYLYKTKITVNGNNISYSPECTNQTPAQMTEEKYKKLGRTVIKDYLEKVSLPDKITYYIAGIGIKPWHNGSGNDTFQGYWQENMLTHMFRFVPEAFKKLINTSNSTPIEKNNTVKGYLQVLGRLDKKEKRFGVNGSVESTFKKIATTWRLPQLTPEVNAQSYITIKDSVTNKNYFVDLSASAELTSVFENGGINAIVDVFNNANSYDLYSKYLYDEETVKFQLNNPSGLWVVFDGNDASTIGNRRGTGHSYAGGHQREVAYITFKFTESILSLNEGQGRNRIKNEFVEINGSTILPNSGVTNMIYTW